MMMPKVMFCDWANACRRVMSRAKTPAASACQSTSMCRNAGGVPRARSRPTIVSIAAALENGYASMRPMRMAGWALCTADM